MSLEIIIIPECLQTSQTLENIENLVFYHEYFF